MPLQPIATTGDTILAQQAVPVTVFDQHLSQLAGDMLDTMLAANGVGIAAPQIHFPLAMFIMASRPNTRYPDAPQMAPEVVINPVIEAASVELEPGEEGCLSVPDTRLEIWRHTWVQVRFQNLEGQWQNKRLEGFIARIFQHELDHLNGITLIERVRMIGQGGAAQ